MQFSSLVADGSSRGDVGMQIAISHEVCAVSRSCFSYYGKNFANVKKNDIFLPFELPLAMFIKAKR